MSTELRELAKVIANEIHKNPYAQTQQWEDALIHNIVRHMAPFIESSLQAALAERTEAAAQIIDDEIAARESFEDHIEPIDVLRDKIRALSPDSEKAALAQLKQQVRLAEAKWWYMRLMWQHQHIEGVACPETECERIAELEKALDNPSTGEGK